jgi:hypothetical protein
MNYEDEEIVRAIRAQVNKLNDMFVHAADRSIRVEVVIHPIHSVRWPEGLSVPQIHGVLSKIL